MAEIRITINGKVCIGKAGQTILQIAAQNGIEIPNLCENGQLKHYAGCGLCVVEAEGAPKLLRACATIPKDGQVIMTDSPRAAQARKITMELLMSDHVGDCKGPCVLNCPAGTQCQAYVKQIALGNDREAVRIIKEKIPMPSSIGRICPHPCESACRRAYVEQPISIAYLKYFAADRVRAAGGWQPKIAPPTHKRVGIIGGGPGGLTAAYYLACKGHDVTVVDAMPQMGGMLRYGIPEYRLPKAVVDAEIAEIAATGVKMQNNLRIGTNISFDAFCRQYDAVIVAIGAWKSTPMRCPGENLSGVFGGIDFLRNVAYENAPSIGKRVAIVGGGNTAMDACRTAIRLGATDVSVIYRRTEAEMPAEAIEIAQAREEGVTFHFLTNPAEILGKDGKVNALKLQVMALGEPDASGRRTPVPVEGKFEYLEVDSVIVAIGQKVNPQGFEALTCNNRGIIATDEATCRTNIDNVFAIGDATNQGASIAIAAIGEAGRCATVVDTYLHGQLIGYRKPYVSERQVTEKDFSNYEKIARQPMPVRPAQERKSDFKEINLGFSEEAARAEAKRCLECGCFDYEECRLIRFANRSPIAPQRFMGQQHPAYTEQRLAAIERNQGKCILCNQCVRICDEVVGKGLLGLVGRGFHTVIKPEFQKAETVQACLNCRKCAEACPTGALKILK